MNDLLLLVWLVPLIVIHELAHVAVGAVVGLRVSSVRIGSGQLLLQRVILDSKALESCRR
jgi:hypothetical protein